MAAVAFNKYCGVGIAYNASIGGESLQIQNTEIQKNKRYKEYKKYQITSTEVLEVLEASVYKAY